MAGRLFLSMAEGHRGVPGDLCHRIEDRLNLFFEEVVRGRRSVMVGRRSRVVGVAEVDRCIEGAHRRIGLGHRSLGNLVEQVGMDLGLCRMVAGSDQRLSNLERKCRLLEGRGGLAVVLEDAARLDRHLCRVVGLDDTALDMAHHDLEADVVGGHLLAAVGVGGRTHLADTVLADHEGAHLVGLVDHGGSRLVDKVHDLYDLALYCLVEDHSHSRVAVFHLSGRMEVVCH
jgi:hypothetical protein